MLFYKTQSEGRGYCYVPFIFLKGESMELAVFKEELHMRASCGIISSGTTTELMLKAEREYYLSKHPFAITKSKSGYFMTYLPDNKGGRVKRRSKDREKLEETLIAYWKDRDVITLEKLIPEWVEYKRKIGAKRNRFKKQTYDRYLTDYYRFIDGTIIAKENIKTLAPYELEEFIIERINTLDLTAKSYAGLRTLLRGSLNYYKKREKMIFDPESFFRSLDLRAYFADRVEKPQVFSDEEVEKIIGYINEHDESIVSLGILFGFYTGLRIGEISALTWEDVEDGVIFVHRTEERFKNTDGAYEFRVRDTPKTKAGCRKVVLTHDANSILQRMYEINPDGEFVFMNKGNRIKGDTYTNKLGRICGYLNLPKRSMHKARKTYASHLFRAGVDEALIIDQMGHADIETTKQYYRRNLTTYDEARKSIEAAVTYSKKPSRDSKGTHDIYENVRV